jgi:hypothetical protein
VVEAANQLPEFYIEYPTFHLEQKKIAEGVEEKSNICFANCADCVLDPQAI